MKKMLIQEQYNKLILLEIKLEQKLQECISLLKKQKKQYQIFQKEQLKYYDFILFQCDVNTK